MKLKYYLMAFAMTAALGTTLTSCDDDETTVEGTLPGGGGDQGGNIPEGAQAVAGNVSGTWARGSVIHVTGDITVPQGQSLTIEEGVTVIFTAEQVLNGDRGYEFIVDGNLYVKGTEAEPVLLSVDESLRTQENATRGLWGGIIGTQNCAEMLIDHAIIEYTGTAVTENSLSAQLGIYESGEDFGPQITTYNENGSYVVTNSVLRYGNSDAIYMMGGKGIIAHNLFAVNGDTGGEAVNCKAGCQVDVAFNVMYSPNTNGLKLSSSGEEDGRSQARIRAYNNTIVNAGWRRDGNKGGGIYVEENALVSVYNTLLVNCKFKAQTPDWGTPGPDEGPSLSCVIDYNYYISGTQTSDMEFDLEDGTASAFGNLSWIGKMEEDEDTGEQKFEQVVYPDAIDTHSKQSTAAGTPDPLFVNYDFLADQLHNKAYNEAWDFHVQPNSPALSDGASDGTADNLRPFFAQSGLTVGGTTYTSDAPAQRFGALGTN